MEDTSASQQSTSAAPPPPFPKDCKACSGAQALLQQAFSRFTTTPPKASATPLPRSFASSSDTTTLPHPDQHQPPPPPTSHPPHTSQPPLPCPPDTAKLGEAAWTFLHTTAAYYPDQPTTAQQSLMRSMMDAVAEFYPCHVCAEHLREQVQVSPPQVASGRDLSLWLCKLHNEVNEMLGKPMFDCSRALERWRDGPADGSCD